MPKISESVDKLANDIRDIRRSLYKNRVILQKWLSTGSVRFIYIYSGLLILAFSFLNYYFINMWHGYYSVPQSIRYLLIIGFIFGMAIPGIIKFVSLVSVSDQFTETRSIGLVFKLFGASQMGNYLILEALSIVICVYFGFNGIPQYCVPVISLGVGILMLSVWGQFALSELLVYALWMIVSGLISLPFIARSPNDAWIWLGICMGLGCLLVPVYVWIKTKIKKG